MPENMYSERALLRNGFEKLAEQVEKKNRDGMETVVTNHYLPKSHASKSL